MSHRIEVFISDLLKEVIGKREYPVGGYNRKHLLLMWKTTRITFGLAI
jgi:hypothetical protein